MLRSRKILAGNRSQIPRRTRVQLISSNLVSSVVSSWTPGADKQNNRLPTTGGRQLFTVEKPLFTAALAEITSPETSISEKAPWRLQRSVAVPHPGNS
jgi:hypothetical protein